MSVPLFDTAGPLLPLRAELDGAIARVLDSGHYILGPEVEAFEREFAAYCGAGHAVGVANGTEAITIALRALGVGPGDEVVVPSFTFYASAEAIPPTGATPVFCDIDPETYCVTAETVKAALTPRTKAVIAVHLFGNIAPVAEIEALGVPVLEDAAQAAGSLGAAGRPGSLGTRGDVLASSPPRTSAASATAARSRRPTPRSPSACACCASTAPTTRSTTSTSATTRAWTSCRPRSCASSSRTSTRGPTGAAPPAATTRARASASSSRCPSRRPARTPRGICTSSRTPSPSGWKQR